jgi:hypothetical protein
MNTLEPDKGQLRPSYREVREMLTNLVLTPHSLSDPSLAQFVALIRERYINGGAYLVAFDVGVNPIFHWFASRNRLEEEELLARLLTHETILSNLPDLDIPQAPQLPQISLKPQFSFSIDGTFAQLLYDGGAYWHTNGTGENEKRLALEVCHALFDSRYAEIQVYACFEPWTRWFKGVAWDYTFALFDKRRARLSLFVITDTD